MFEEPEGATPLDPDEMEGLKFKHISTRADLDEIEQANIVQGLRWLALQRGGNILKSDFVCKVHTQLFGDIWKWAGSYRLTEKNIGIDPVQISVQLRYLLDDARYWAENKTYAPLEAAARFHHRMVQIHPFPNGNGRHARISADMYLEQYFNHLPIEWANGFDLQANNDRRSDYLTALRTADAGNFDLLLKFTRSK